MTDLAFKFWTDDTGQDIAEYAVMLAVILVLVVGTIRLVGSNANNAFSTVASTFSRRSPVEHFRETEAAKRQYERDES